MSKKSEMRVVLSPVFSPRKIGIAQSKDSLWAISDCCEGDLNLNVNTKHWYCGECWRTVIRADAPGLPSSSVMQLSEGFTSHSVLRMFVSVWSGLSITEFDIKLEWNETV